MLPKYGLCSTGRYNLGALLVKKFRNFLTNSISASGIESPSL